MAQKNAYSYNSRNSFVCGVVLLDFLLVLMTLSHSIAVMLACISMTTKHELNSAMPIIVPRLTNTKAFSPLIVFIWLKRPYIHGSAPPGGANHYSCHSKRGAFRFPMGWASFLLGNHETTQSANFWCYTKLTSRGRRNRVVSGSRCYTWDEWVAPRVAMPSQIGMVWVIEPAYRNWPKLLLAGVVGFWWATSQRLCSDLKIDQTWTSRKLQISSSACTVCPCSQLTQEIRRHCWCLLMISITHMKNWQRPEYTWGSFRLIGIWRVVDIS